MNCKVSDIVEQFQKAGIWGKNLHKEMTFAQKITKSENWAANRHNVFMFAMLRSFPDNSREDCGAVENAR
jgi:hypothetical protein